MNNVGIKARSFDLIPTTSSSRNKTVVFLRILALNSRDSQCGFTLYTCVYSDFSPSQVLITIINNRYASELTRITQIALFIAFLCQIRYFMQAVYLP
ncbi:hypothetical protein WN53_16035 [Serratia fonticola]|nr:hypothetical protein WN53_16035 [Serratia fonticola]